MVEFGIVIPARFASSRLPGKPLRLIAGKPMIQWVVERARATGAQFVWVATDDARIESVVRNFGGDVVMTSSDHATGTDRIAEVASKRGLSPETIVVNVQGDEPMLPPTAIVAVAEALENNAQAQISTLAHHILSVDELFDSNVVKVVLGDSSRALYFSRAPIPWVRESFAQDQPTELPQGVPFLRHIGLYAYRVAALTALSRTLQSKLEKAESLEQLRALDAGIGIHVAIVDEALPPGVDTEQDLDRVERVIQNQLQASSQP